MFRRRNVRQMRARFEADMPVSPGFARRLEWDVNLDCDDEEYEFLEQILTASLKGLQTIAPNARLILTENNPRQRVIQ